MNPSDLRARIDAIKKQEKPAVPRHNSGLLTPPENALFENGWRRLSDMVYERISWSGNPLPERISDFLLSGGADASRLVFYDTETTGLSGGAGNIVFLAGFGFAGEGKLKTVQIMLTDFPGEPAFLEAIGHYISKDKIYVSYNGRSFDAAILNSRFAMNGMALKFGFQLDLLYPARRLWKSVIGSCSLGDIEKNILGKKRVLDVPGAMVPDLYFDFIKRGEYSAIEGVAAHHLEDILSLVQLLSVFEAISANPEKPMTADRVGLARQLMISRPEAAVNVLCAGFDEGSYRAAIELGLHYKRCNNYKEASGVWSSMWSARKSIYAGIELAKHFEHREKEIDKALLITDEILSFERIRIRSILPELEKRRARLEKKVKRRGYSLSGQE